MLRTHSLSSSCMQLSLCPREASLSGDALQPGSLVLVTWGSWRFDSQREWVFTLGGRRKKKAGPLPEPLSPHTTQDPGMTLESLADEQDNKGPQRRWGKPKKLPRIPRPQGTICHRYGLVPRRTPLSAQQIPAGCCHAFWWQLATRIFPDSSQSICRANGSSAPASAPPQDPFPALAQNLMPITALLQAHVQAGATFHPPPPPTIHSFTPD